jgi:serine/threonine-protein kinase
MADVHLTVMRGQNGFTKLVVVKEVRKDLGSDPEFERMFLAESRLTARLNHPNVVQTYEVGTEAQRHFLAMEYLEGVPYWKLARATGDPAPLEIHVRILIEALAGLHYAHELTDFDGAPLGIVHKDVSPQNIIVTYDGAVKVIDFGISNRVALENPAEGFRGKLAYMAPEQARGLMVDRRAEVFSAGIMMWEALTGERLWSRDRDTLLQVLQDEIPDVRTLRPEVPARLATICARALSRDPNTRYTTAAEMERALEDWLVRRGVAVTRRDVGNWVSARYADERRMMRRQIEAHLFVRRDTVQLSAPNDEARDRTPVAVVVRPPSRVSHAPQKPPPKARARSALGSMLMMGVAALVGFLSWHTVGPEVTSLTARAPVPRWVAAKTVPRLGHSREADALTTLRAPAAEEALAMPSMLGARGQAEPATAGAVTRAAPRPARVRGGRAGLRYATR